MDADLATFEASLAKEKSDREKEKEREKRYRHRERSRDRRRDRDRDHRHHSRSYSRDHDRERDHDFHRYKRRRSHSRDKEASFRSHRHRERSKDRHRSSRHDRNKEKSQDKEKDKEKDKDVTREFFTSRDDWMTTPSALQVDYVSRPVATAPPPKPDSPKPREFFSRELNCGFNDDPSEPEVLNKLEIDYKFGDVGSRWRMVKLDAVFRAADNERRPVDEIAVERFGSLQAFDIAREEKEEIEKHRLYGLDYQIKESPDGHIYNERIREEQIKGKGKQVNNRLNPGIFLRSGIRMPEEQQTLPQQTLTPIVDQTTLNRMRAVMIKAKLHRAPNAAQLEAEYNAAAVALASASSSGSSLTSDDIIIGAMESRMLAGTRNEVKAVTTKRGTLRGNVVANDDMTINDMIREERRTKGVAGGEAKRLAERISKDGKFDDNLEYMDENAEKLAERVHKSEVSLKNTAVHEYQKVQRILDNCPLCHHEDKPDPHPQAPIVSMGIRTYLTLAPEPELTSDCTVIVPKIHHVNLLHCDDDEWEEIRNFMKSLTRLYHDQGRDVVFYENAAHPGRRRHAAMVAVPIPYEDGAMIPAYFKEGFLTSDTEWLQHKAVIDTLKAAKDGLGRAAFRRMIAKEAPYFHVWFALDGGMGHVVEDVGRWPGSDQFAREILGGVMDVEGTKVKREGRWMRSDRRVVGFKGRWKKFDWTRMLEEAT